MKLLSNSYIYKKYEKSIDNVHLFLYYMNVIFLNTYNMTKITYTGQLTVNKKVKEMVKKMFPNIATVTKSYVSQIGIVYYLKDSVGSVIAKIYTHRDYQTKQVVIHA